MHVNRSTLATGLFLLSAGAALAAPPIKDGVLGYYNAATGAFHPLPRAGIIRPDTTPATGTISVSFTITLATPGLGASTPILCEVDADTVLDEGVGGYIDDISAATATVTGSSAKCTVKIPYSWAGVTTKDTIGLSYTVTAASTSGSLIRTFSSPITNIAVPANGTASNFSVSTVL